MKADSDQ